MRLLERIHHAVERILVDPGVDTAQIAAGFRESFLDATVEARFAIRLRPGLVVLPCTSLLVPRVSAHPSQQRQRLFVAPGPQRLRSFLEVWIRPHGLGQPDQSLARSRRLHVRLIDRVARLCCGTRFVFGSRVGTLQYFERAIEVLDLGVPRRVSKQCPQVLRLPRHGHSCSAGTVPGLRLARRNPGNQQQGYSQSGRSIKTVRRPSGYDRAGVESAGGHRCAGDLQFRKRRRLQRGNEPVSGFQFVLQSGARVGLPSSLRERHLAQRPPRDVGPERQQCGNHHRAGAGSHDRNH